MAINNPELVKKVSFKHSKISYLLEPPQQRGPAVRGFVELPEYLPGESKGVVGDDREGAETEGSNQKGREQGVQGGDIE